jgi:phage-related minor tail protein
VASKSQVTLTFAGDAAKLKKVFDDVEKRSGIFGSKMGKVGAAAAVGVTALVAGAATAGKKLFELGSSFDAASDMIVAGTGASGDALKGLEKSFDNVLVSGPHSMENTATAIADLNTALGLTGKPLEKLSSQFLDLGRVSKEEVGGQIQSLTRVFGDWGVAVEDQALTMDKLWQVSQSTGIGVSELGDQLVKTGAPMRQLGFSIDETAALMGKWNKEGVNSEVVFSGLRQGISKMARAGLDVPTAFRGAVEAIKGAETASEATTLAIETFGSRAGPDLAAAIREGRFEIDDLVADMANAEGSIARTADETASFGEKWQEFKNKLSVAFKPAAIAVFDAMGKALDYIGPILTDKVVPAVQSFFSTLQNGESTAGGAIQKIGDTAREWFPKIVEFGRKVVDFIRQDFIPAAVRVWETIQEVWSKIGPDVKRIFGQVVSVIKTATDLVLQVIRTVTTIVRAIWDRWGSEITALAKAAWTLISGTITGALNIIEGIFRTVTALLRGDWSAAWEGIKQITRGATTIIRSVISTAFQIIRTLTSAAWSAIKSTITRSIDQAKDFVRRAINSIISFFRGIPGRVASALSGLASKVTKPFRDAYNGAKKWLDKIPGVGSVKSVASGIKSRIPFLHSGGVYKAPTGQSEGLAVLRSGETVVTPEQRDKGMLGGGPTMIVIDSGGSQMDDLIVQIIRKSIRNRGGTVQEVLG